MSKHPDRAALIDAMAAHIRNKQRTNPRYGRAQLARDAGIAKSTVTDIMSGKTKNISSNTLAAILGVINNQLLVYRTMYPRTEEEPPIAEGEIPPEIIEMFRSDPVRQREVSERFAKLSPLRQTRLLEYLRGLGEEE